MIVRRFVIAIAVCLLCPCVFAQQYSLGPGYKGEEILSELLIGKKTLAIKVGSNGCTDKGSYNVDVKKVKGITPIAPHYILTINRIHTDSCKAIVDDGPVIIWDLEKELGVIGPYTVSVQNRVNSPHPFMPLDEENSMVSAVKKYLELEGAESPKEAPEENKDRRKL